MTKRWMVLVTLSLATLLALVAPTPVARADIFQWEYINPANPSQGKQPSTMLAPDGAGANAVPAANLSYRDLTKAYLIGADLSEISVWDDEGSLVSRVGANLTAVNLSQADLTNANLGGAKLTATDFTNAEVRGTNLSATAITAAQIYSTASYLAHDLTGIGLSYNNLTDLNLASQNLTSAQFYAASLANANLSQANLTNANFWYTTLTSANLSGAEVRGADFFYDPYNGYGGITLAQLYSTASYLAHDLTGIGLLFNDLTGANLAGQNLTNADFTYATLTGANLTGANLTNASFSGYHDEYGTYYGDLTGANLSGADARGANFQYATLAGANTSNLIQSDGHIAGLDLTAGASLVIRDYDGNPTVTPPAGPLPIVVEQHLATDATGTLRLVFDADPWDSLISFAPGIPVALSGTLDLTFAPGVNVATQSGRTIDLFDWTGVAPTGAFTVSSPYTWNLSKLYTTGEVILVAPPAIPGDFNNNGVVDAADYVVWRKTDGTPADYNVWRAHFGQTTGSGATAGLPSSAIPEPASAALLLLSAAGLLFIPRRWVAAKNRG